MGQLSCLHISFLLRNCEVTGSMAGGWRWSYIQDITCVMYLLFCQCYRMYSHPCGKGSVRVYGRSWVQHPALPFGSIFHIFTLFCTPGPTLFYLFHFYLFLFLILFYFSFFYYFLLLLLLLLLLLIKNPKIFLFIIFTLIYFIFFIKTKDKKTFS